MSLKIRVSDNDPSLQAMRANRHDWPNEDIPFTTVMRKAGKKRPSLSYYDRKTDPRSSFISLGVYQTLRSS